MSWVSRTLRPVAFLALLMLLVNSTKCLEIKDIRLILLGLLITILMGTLIPIGHRLHSVIILLGITVFLGFAVVVVGFHVVLVFH